MRHWLLIVMIALLPLRGWAGDAMALSMWATPGSPQAMAPCHETATPVAAVATEVDSHHATADGSMAHGSDAGSGAQHATCNACDVCNGPAISLALNSTGTVPSVHAPIAPACEHFASAEPQRGSKPPIV